MRQINLILLLIIFNTPLLHAQVNPGPDIAWQECYGGESNDFFTDAILLPDGSIVVNLHATSFMEYEYYGSWVIKYDENFNELWRVQIGDSLCSSTVFDIELSTNNLILVYGQTLGCTDSIGFIDLIVVCIDQEGIKLWSRSYGSTQGDNSHTLHPTSDGGFLVGGSTRGFDGDLYMPVWNDLFYDDALIMKMDSLGEVEWVDIVGGTNPEIVSSNFLEVSAGQYLVMIASSSYDYDLAGSSEDDLKKHLLRVYDLDGNVLKENILSADDNLIDQWNTLQLLPDGNVHIAGTGIAESDINPTFPEHDGFEGALAIINEELELIDLNLFGGLGNEYFLDIIPATIGGYYCLGYSSSAEGDLPGNYGEGDMWVLHVDASYDLVWSKNLGSAGTDLFTSQSGALIEKDNMLYMLSQVSAQAGNPTGDLTCGDPTTNKVDAWLVALDLTTVGVENEPPQTSIKLYPNPVNHTLTILLPVELSNQARYNILDITGAIIETGQFQQKVHQINTANFPDGVFLIVIQLNEQVYTNVFVKD
jgi:hypothetical protein